jgi:fluoride exporter
MNLYKILLVGLGGFTGSIARYLSTRSIDQMVNTIFPYGTLAVNVVGSFILGIIYGWIVQKGGDGENTRLLLITGFCGGFTTFSAFAFENLNLIDQKMTGMSLLYIISSVVAGILAVAIGAMIGKAIAA